ACAGHVLAAGAAGPASGADPAGCDPPHCGAGGQGGAGGAVGAEPSVPFQADPIKARHGATLTERPTRLGQCGMGTKKGAPQGPVVQSLNTASTSRTAAQMQERSALLSTQASSASGSVSSRTDCQTCTACVSRERSSCSSWLFIFQVAMDRRGLPRLTQYRPWIARSVEDAERILGG
ncbi:MAG: hypothetical protein EBV32_05985, partial [Proteobacteria bacterium]|nr:hypothetical protein [Candidatus Fonsibacter lacus]